MLLPFMDTKESAFLTRFLKEDSLMYEWGSGGSTLFFPKFVKKYYSVEHNKEWYDKIKDKIPSNVDYSYKKSSIPYTRPRDWRTNPSYNGTPSDIFAEYINHISTIDKMFDVVLVDGRCRVQCAIKAKEYLKEDGILFFHDFFPRKQYHSILDHYDIISKIDTTTQTIAAMRVKKI